MIKFLLKLTILILVLIAVAYYFLARSEKPEEFAYGVTFSQKYAQELGLDWQETYLAILDDLKIKKLRLVAYWDEIEPKQGQYNFQDLDWQIQEAGKRNAEVVLTIGYRLPRWPECYIPEWAEKEDVLDILEVIIKRYRNNPNIVAWQVENEPFVWWFGECPKASAKLLDREIFLVRALDGERPVLLTDSGEFSLWWRMGKRADIFGTTLYRKGYIKWLGYVKWPLPSFAYKLRAKIIKTLFRLDDVIVIELQGEPWVPKGKSFETMSLEEQRKGMNPEELGHSVEFAKDAGFSTLYFWGAEYWYWLKEKLGDNAMWEEVKKIL